MLSKNNRKEQFRKQEPKKQRFAIKKLTVGVASVLIGFTFMGMNASADTTTGANKAGNQVVGESQNSTSVNQTDDSQVALPTPNSQGTKSAVSDASGQATKAAAAKNGDASVTTPASSSAAPVSTVSDQQTSNTASANEQNQASGNESKATVATRANKLRITDKATILATANPSQGQTLEVNDWNSFGAALMNVGRKSRDFSHGMDRPLQAR